MKAPKEARDDEVPALVSAYLRPLTWFRRLVIGRLVFSLSLTYLDKKEQKTSLYNRLPALRAERGLSHQYLADALGISPWTVVCIERGEYNPSLELALRISRIFDLPIDEIFIDTFSVSS